jgi:LPXTG-motif cell wall-anchored protein
MRKLMVLGAMLVMMLVVAAPAVAQVGQGFSERRITSGKASPSTRISNTGDNVNICAPVQQVVNTGNVANEQGITAYESRLDDVDFEGSDITMEPSETVECTQSIEQAAAAGPGGEAKAGGAVATAGGAVAAVPAPAGGGGGGPVAAVVAPVLAPGGVAGVAARAGGGMLPSTGGPAGALILALGAGALLVGGGLMAYRRFTL